MRNIYIESDIGLFTEQKDIKRSTVYSFNTEQVTNISQTFITLSLRMEK